MKSRISNLLPYTKINKGKVSPTLGLYPARLAHAHGLIHWIRQSGLRSVFHDPRVALQHEHRYRQERDLIFTFDILLLMLMHKYMAFVNRVITTRTGIHRGDQLKVGRKCQRLLARLIVMTLSSIGWHSTSRTHVPNSGNSSRNNTARCASAIAPGFGRFPHPLIIAIRVSSHINPKRKITGVAKKSKIVETDGVH
jgi:hypothetical protein